MDSIAKKVESVLNMSAVRTKAVRQQRGETMAKVLNKFLREETKRRIREWKPKLYDAERNGDEKFAKFCRVSKRDEPNLRMRSVLFNVRDRS